MIVQREDGVPIAAFQRGSDAFLIHPSQLSSVQTVYAMTIHRSPGQPVRHRIGDVAGRGVVTADSGVVVHGDHSRQKPCESDRHRGFREGGSAATGAQGKWAAS